MRTLDMEIERLRQRAMAAMAVAPDRPTGLPDDMMDALRLVEELRVYQTELEIQNQDLKAAQMQTESAMRRYRRLFENLPLDGLILDGQGFIVEANAAARSHFALHANAALQRRSVYQLFAFESRAKLYSVLGHGLDVASASEVQLMAPIAAQSTEVDAHVITVDPAALDQDERLMVLVDRTFERRLAASHRELLRSEARHRALFEDSRVPMLLIDPKSGLVVRGNAAAFHFYGYGQETLEGMPVTRINCMDPSENLQEMHLASTQKRDHFFFAHRLASGQEVPVEVHSGPIEIDGQTLLYSIVHDISARVEAQQKADAGAQAALIANRHYQSLLDAASEVSIIATDTAGVVQVFNRGAERMLGYSAAEVAGTTCAIDFHLQDEVQLRAQELSIELGTPVNGFGVFTSKPDRDGQEQREWTYRCKNGETLDVALVVTAVRSAAGEITGYLGIAQDTTQRKQAQANLQLSANVFTWAREGILITDAKSRIIQVNVAFSRITGYSEEDVIGQFPSILKSGRQESAFYARMWQSLRAVGHWEGEIWNRRKSGEVYAELLSISAVHDSHNKIQNYVALFTDISSQKAHEQELEHIARYDMLTGLPNRALLADRLQQEMAHCARQRKQLAVVFIDLDGFKQVNDMHGHNIGDEVLIGLAQRMKTALREGDTLSRIGGDEFVAVLTALDHPRDCEIVLSRLLEAAAKKMAIDGTDIQVSASIGVTLFPQDAGEPDLLLRHADHAMYQAKQAGKNRYHYFDVKDDADVKTHRESIDEIQAALERGEFVLNYQPKVNMKTGLVIGMEALIRWQHPVRGMLLPAQFLPIVKGHPLIVQIGEWVVCAAVAQLDAWNALGLQLAVSVNIDALHLQQHRFVASLVETLAKHPGVRASQLDLEVLETSALDDIDNVTAIMQACCDLGLGFSLDDFGTGYSSLTYLKRLPADLMKIDQSFVIGMLHDSDDFVIVEGVLGLARAFGRGVLAEGVETAAHGELLLALGCELGQGYGIAHAMPASAVPGWVATWQADASWAVWNLPSDTDTRRDLVIAEIKHRHWLRDVENHVTGKSEVCPSLHTAECPLGQWITAEGSARHGNHHAYTAMTACHEQIHEHARHLVDRMQNGDRAGVEAGLSQFVSLRGELMAAIRRLGHP